MNSADTHPGAASDTKQRVMNFMQSFTLEVTPAGAKRIHDFREHIAKGTWVYVTALSGSDFNETVETCRKLAEQGMTPVPHFTARSMASARALDDHLQRVTSEAGVTRVLAIAGADSKP